MRRHLWLLSLLTAVLVVPILGCTDATLQAAPGFIAIEVQLNSATPGQYNMLAITATGTWLSSTTGGVPAGGETTYNYTHPTLTPANQTEVITLPTSGGLREGNWEFTILVTGSGTTTILDTLCNQEIFRAQTTTVQFTEGGTSCTCTMGCSGP